MSLGFQHLVPQMVSLFGEILESEGSRVQLEEVGTGSGPLSLYFGVWYEVQNFLQLPILALYVHPKYAAKDWIF